MANCIEKFLTLIPKTIHPSSKKASNHFVRERKLPFAKLITFILSIAASGKSSGVEGKSREFFKNARRSGLWPDVQAVHRSSVTKARNKISWELFRDLLNKAIEIAYDVFPQKDDFLWHGMSVFATDGSFYTLPATKEIRDKYDPDSGLQIKGKGHYPQCLISTLYDVFRRLPVAKTVVPIFDANEREQAKRLLPFVPENSVWLFDRGYPGYELINHLIRNYAGYFVIRCPVLNTFPVVKTFVKSGKRQDTVWLDPSGHFLKNKTTKKTRDQYKSCKLRIIKLIAPDGTVSVLLTNLYDKKVFTRKDIIDLYFKRWEIEVHYRDEKVTIEIETFHSKTVNGILQELYAAMIMSVISRTLMVLASEEQYAGEKEFQFKNAIMAVATDAAVLVTKDPEKALSIFDEILREISRVKYYRPKNPRPAQSRMTKKSIKKWLKNNQKHRA